MIIQTADRHSVSIGNSHLSSVSVSRQTQPLEITQEKVCTHSYDILHISEGETALLYFATNPLNNQRIVIKILKEYRDLRLDMMTLEKRQQCQLEALEQNRYYSPDIYYGLARVYGFCSGLENKKKIILGEIIERPQKSDLDENGEYALVMRWLPESRRLDFLLKKKAQSLPSLLRYMDLLSETIAKTHEANEQNIPSNCELRWGSCEQLQEKLEHNLPFRIRALHVVDDEQLGNYNDMEKAFARMNKLMSRALQLKEFRAYFESRVEQHRVLRCHGDLKAANIWILAAEEQHRPTLRERVKILDTIDFNESYCNIDILADMAMLAVDIDMRTSQEVAQHFIRRYLALTRQENEAARAVMTYYLVEKAMIGAIVSYVYDKKPALGLKYVQVAQRHMVQLHKYERSFWYKSLTKETLHHVKAGAMSGVVYVWDQFTRTLRLGSESRLDTASTSMSAICPEQTIQGD